MRSYISTTLFDLFKTGPGPSSSHTIGPMRAGYDFARLCAGLPPDILGRAKGFRVHLFGSLSATGCGHGTDGAVVAGLLGTAPEDCPPNLLFSLTASPETAHPVNIGGVSFLVRMSDVVHDAVAHDFPYSNTLIIGLVDGEGRDLFSRTYFSVGGGFVQWEGWKPAELGSPIHKYGSMAELRNIADEQGLNLYEIILNNEQAITGMSRSSILHDLDVLIDKMEACVLRGLDSEGLLPGNLGVQRKAKMLFQHASRLDFLPERFLARLNAYAFAAAEENAAGGVIVTAPTCGASGVMPSLIYAMRHDLGIGDRAVREGFLAAAAIGFLVRHNASIAGADVGCQGEIGTASAMGAAMLTDARGNAAWRTENAAETALEHHLGLTCDPVGGLVQIPCIERNAVGVIKAYNASLIAIGINPRAHRVRLDAAIAAMRETGREMNQKFKETSLGGLAVSMVNC